MNCSLKKYDLRKLLEEIVARYPNIQAAILFGSRNFGTRSDRSDIDIILRHNGHIKPSELRNLTQELCPALDLFLCDNNRAISCANESYVSAETFELLIDRLNGTRLWARNTGFSSTFHNWEVHIPEGIEFPPTAIMLPPEQYKSWEPRVREFMQDVEKDGFPTKPFIGVTAIDVAYSMISSLRGAVDELTSLDARGASSNLRLNNEYDFQNLFHLVCKAWLPSLAREEIIISYDGQDKRSDFSFLNNRIVFEFKHVKNVGTKAAVIKTLAGLTEFYTSHPNIAVLVNVVLVDANVELDDRRWENDYSYLMNSPQVWTTVVRNAS